MSGPAPADARYSLVLSVTTRRQITYRVTRLRRSFGLNEHDREDLEQEALTSFLPLCEKRGIGIILGGPYNSGILATGARPGAYYNYTEAPADIFDVASVTDDALDVSATIADLYTE